MHDNRTVVLSRGARIPRHFPDTCCPLPSRAAATAVSLSRPGREEPSEPAAARRRLPFFLVRSRHRHRAHTSGSSSGIRSRSSPAALHHPVLRARSSRAMRGYDVMHLPLFLRRVSGCVCECVCGGAHWTPNYPLKPRPVRIETFPFSHPEDPRPLPLIPPALRLQVPGSAAADVRSAPFRSSCTLQLQLPHSLHFLSHTLTPPSTG